MKKVLRNEFVVRCAPEEAFAFLSDMRNELEWNPEQCQFVEKLTGGPIGLGTRYRAKWKGSPAIEAEYVQFDAPRSWRAHSEGGLQTNFACTLAPHADGTLIRSELEFIPRGLFVLAWPVFLVMFSLEESTEPEKIRRALEARYAAPAGSAPHPSAR